MMGILWIEMAVVQDVQMILAHVVIALLMKVKSVTTEIHRMAMDVMHHVKMNVQKMRHDWVRAFLV